MKTLCSVLMIALLSSATMDVRTALAQPQPETLLPDEKARQIVVVRDVKPKDGEILGEVVNVSSRPLRDVQLLIRYIWHWKNEFKPARDDLGMAVYHTVREEIAPGKAVQFNYKPPSPLPSRPDGFFETTVSVAAFTEVIR